LRISKQMQDIIISTHREETQYTYHQINFTTIRRYKGIGTPKLIKQQTWLNLHKGITSIYLVSF